MREIKLLDCTLRDGGFINDWEFGYDDIINIFERAVSAKTDIIEIGFIDERREYDRNRTIFPDGEAVNKTFEGLDAGDAQIVGMIDYGTCSIDRIQECKSSIMDGIRVIFKKKNMQAAVEFCGQIKDKGYRVYVQPVSITSYSDEEMLELIGMVNALKPEAMSLVDTYGLLHEGGLLHFYELMDENLDSDISIGYHAHNNFQLGYSNCIALMEQNIQKNNNRSDSEKRTLVVDGSIFGMGKGAGNTPIELLAMYMNAHCDKNYDINQMLETIDVSVMQIYLKLPWGYSLKYFLAASNNCHPNYVQYLMQKRTLSVKSINEILEEIPAKEKLTYNADLIAELLADYQNNKINDKTDVEKLSKLLSESNVLVLGPGPSIESNKSEIQAYIAKNRPVVISINFLPEDFYLDYIFLSNAKRYVTLEGKLSGNGNKDKTQNVKVIASSNVTPTKDRFDYQVDYESLIDQDFEIPDSSFIMLLKLLVRLGVKEVSLAGFDGYTSAPGENYFNIAMEYAFIKDKSAALNDYTKRSLKKLEGQIKMNFITPSRYMD